MIQQGTFSSRGLTASEILGEVPLEVPFFFFFFLLKSLHLSAAVLLIQAVSVVSPESTSQQSGHGPGSPGVHSHAAMSVLPLSAQAGMCPGWGCPCTLKAFWMIRRSGP